MAKKPPATSSTTPAALLPAGIFHPLAKGAPSIRAAATTLSAFLQSHTGGVAEKLLLQWFAEAGERIALFALGLPKIAGLNADVADALSIKRLAHWREHVGFGNNLHISTFDALPEHTISLLDQMAVLASTP